MRMTLDLALFCYSAVVRRSAVFVNKNIPFKICKKKFINDRNVFY